MSDLPAPQPSEPQPSSSGWSKRYWMVVVVCALLLGGCWIVGQVDDPSPRLAPTTTIPCQDALADMNESIRLGLLEAEWFTESLLMGDISGAQAHYDNTTFLSELMTIQVDSFLDRCGSFARAEGVYTSMLQAPTNLESGLARIQRICRQELAPSGFDC